MQNSGSKLVFLLLGLALLLGIGSWWYRYEAAHRASQFWGPVESRLIAEGEEMVVGIWDSEPPAGTSASDAPNLLLSNLIERHDLTHVRGQAHLRHAFMSDRNYLWDKKLDAATIRWRWHLRFQEDGMHVTVLLSEDFKSIGKLDASGRSESGWAPGLTSDPVIAYSCAPMAGSLRNYFVEIGLTEEDNEEDNKEGNEEANEGQESGESESDASVSEPQAVGGTAAPGA